MGDHRLPIEILLQVFSYLPDDDDTTQSTLHSLCLVDRQWYNAALGRLYEYPKITPTNFELFVRTLCPTILLRIKKSDLASLVKVLDLQHIVHHGSKKITARLLGRTKPSLEVFVAPQSSFAINSWAAIAHCLQLRVLNLSLVCESITLSDLCRSVHPLSRLELLYFPRAGVITERPSTEEETWPDLKELHLAGRLEGTFIQNLSSYGKLPMHLTRLSVSNCPILNAGHLFVLLDTIGPQLRNLTVCSLPRVPTGDMDDVLILCPGLLKLSVAVELVTERFSAPTTALNGKRPPHPHPLRDLRIVRTADTLDEDALTPLDLDVGIDSGFFENLRRIVVNQYTGWTRDRDFLIEMEDLSTSLNTLCASEKFGTVESTETTHGLKIEQSVEKNSQPLLDW